MGKIVIINGNDEYMKNSTLSKIRKSINITNEMNFIQFISPKFEDVIDEIQMPSFTKEEKMVVVYDSKLFDKSVIKSEEEKVLEFFGKSDMELEDTLEYTTLIFFEENIIENSVYNVISKSRLFKNFTHNKLTVENRAKYILDLAKKDNVNLSYMEARYLCEVIEDDTFSAINEYNKLKFLDKALIGEKITKQDIDKTVIKSDDAIVYKIIDYIMAKDYNSAFLLIDNFAKENKSQIVLVYLYKYIRNSYVAHLAKSKGHENKLIEILELKPNQRFMQNRYLDFAKRLGVNKCKYIMEEITKIDSESKISTIDVAFRLKALINMM